MSEPFTGGCLCGAVRYAVSEGESKPYLCHCSDCRRYAGAAFHAAIVVAADTVRVEGQPARSIATADSGRSIARYFCADCGGHLFTSPWPAVTRYSVKAGTMDDPASFRPEAEIWTKSRLDWVSPVAGADQFEEGFIGGLTIGALPAAKG